MGASLSLAESQRLGVCQCPGAETSWRTRYKMASSWPKSYTCLSFYSSRSQASFFPSFLNLRFSFTSCAWSCLPFHSFLSTNSWCKYPIPSVNSLLNDQDHLLFPTIFFFWSGTTLFSARSLSLTSFLSRSISTAPSDKNPFSIKRFLDHNLSR